MKNWFKKNWKIFTVIAVLVFAVITLGAMHSLPKQPVIEEVAAVEIDYQMMEDATVIVTHAYGLTSGVIISEDGYVLSCAHGGAPKAVYAKTYYDDMDMALILEYDVITIFQDRSMDISIYKIVSDRTWTYAKFATETPEQSQDVFAIGCPLGAPYYISWGKTIKYLSRPDTGESYILHSCSGNAGNSGGPLFNMNGEIVGINVFMYAALSTTAGYVPLIDGVLAIKIKDFIPAIWGIIETYKNLQPMVEEFKTAQKHVDDLNRERPN